MFKYFLKRILLVIPTFIGITLVSFFVINLAPGSPIEQKLQAARFGGGGEGSGGLHGETNNEVIESLKRQYGFDKPIHERYIIWLKNIAHLDFGRSFSFEEPAMDVIASKFPVSLQFGVTSLILTYLICVPLGMIKAIKAGSRFDHVSGLILYFTYSIPPLILGIFLIVFFAGGSHLSWFPIGLVQSDNFDSLSFFGKVADRVHHFVLPMICYMIGGFTEMTMLMRNSMLDVIKSDYIRTARAKGLDDKNVYFHHGLRNALIPMVTNLPAFFGIFLAGSIVIENIFQLDGIGMLSYKSILARDYNVIMGILFLSSIVLLAGRLVSDLVYVVVDPRIDFK